ncbi:MAG: MoxR family ATPase [Planctomycetota bacterium]|nr:MAG: MoxR family ATPase [Planctomycetota bacterium]
MDKPTLHNATLSQEDAATVGRLTEARTRLRAEIAKAVVGQDTVLDHLLMALLCRGHVLMLGVPGLGKTLMARTIARALEMDYRRIQFTPDLMPSDITGTDIIEEDPDTGRRKLEFFSGPLFTNFLLADEINRAPPKTQAALLQAMQELEVSVGRRTYKLEPPFFVVATQNPIEQEGTYPLPEAQLDRFMFNVPVTYPTPDEEVTIVKSTTANVQTDVKPVLKAGEILRLQELVRGVPVADAVVRYAVTLVGASRPGYSVKQDSVHKFIRYGASPRAAQYLILGAKARAILRGHFHVDFADVRAVAVPVIRHRVVLNFHARAEGVDADTIIQRLLKVVPEK